MKKTILSLVLAILCIILIVYFIVSSSGSMFSLDFIIIPYLIVVFIFGLYMGVSRLLSLRNSEPIDDEMSKKIKMKAASYSYYISLYMWILVIFLKDRINYDKDELFGIGIVIMSFIFITTWSILRLRGIRGE